MHNTPFERGAASVEMVLLTPVLVSLLLLVVALGRLASIDGVVHDTARDAARTAAAARSSNEARIDAVAMSRTMLGERTAGCPSPAVSVDTSQWRAGGSVAVDIRCDVPLSDVAGFGLGGTRTVTARFVEPVDQWRGIR